MHHIRRLAAALLLFVPAALAAQRGARPAPKEYVIVHGAWGGAWDWKAVDSALTARGHHVHRVTLTGLGERSHLASPAIGLETHIMDVVNTIRFEGLRNVILVGHSYGGMVITGAADRVPERIRRLVYVDAFVPDSGESVESLLGAEFQGVMGQRTRDGLVLADWVTPDQQPPFDTAHPLASLTDRLVLHGQATRTLRGSYILTIDKGATTDSFVPMSVRGAARGFTVDTLIADHTPERSAIPPLVRLLAAVR